MSLASPEDVIQFWLGDLDGEGLAAEATSARWWNKSGAFDAECTRRFEPTHAAIVAGKLEDWRSTPRGTLAYVLVLDQLSRNMFRGHAKMYAADALAADAAVRAVDAEDDRSLVYQERYFLYMPLMHAEDLALQDRCVSLFNGLVTEFPVHAERARKGAEYAVLHRDIVARFGRFPHRNNILGRKSTAEEITFLEGPNSSF